MLVIKHSNKTYRIALHLLVIIHPNKKCRSTCRCSVAVTIATIKALSFVKSTLLLPFVMSEECWKSFSKIFLSPNAATPSSFNSSSVSKERTGPLIRLTRKSSATSFSKPFSSINLQTSSTDQLSITFLQPRSLCKPLARKFPLARTYTIG